jgi:hypothetical protein
MMTSNYFGKVIHVGDMVQYNDSTHPPYALADWGEYNGNMLFAIGNHDTTGATMDFRQEFLQNSEYVFSADADSTSDARYEYYWDDRKHKIRYIVHHYTSTGGAGELNYLSSIVDQTPSDYAIVSMCHYRRDAEIRLLHKIIGRNLDYIGNLCGHEHIDEQLELFDGIYHRTTFNNDGNSWQAEGYEKTDGNISSQSFTIMSINRSLRQVKFYRIGLSTVTGKQWEYTYKNGANGDGWQSGYYWADGRANSSSGCFLSPKKYPVKDANSNALTYEISVTSGAINELYIAYLSESGTWLGRKTISTPAPFTPSAWSASAKYCLLSFYSDGNVASTDDISVTATTA